MENQMKHYVVLEVETTGVSAVNDEIIEIAAIEAFENDIKNRYHSYVKPSKEIPENIEKITGIDNEMVKDAPSIDEVLPELFDFIGDKVVVGYHNSDFDFKFITARKGQEMPVKAVDVWKLIKEILPGLRHTTLSDAAEIFGFNGEPRTKMESVEVIMRLFERLRACPCGNELLLKELYETV